MSRFCLLAGLLFSSITSNLPAYLKLSPKICALKLEKTHSQNWRWGFNTGSTGKLREISEIFAALNLPYPEISSVDLREIDSTHENVIINKASQFRNGVIVEDSSLEVEDAPHLFGVNIKWSHSHLPLHISKRAVFASYVAFRVDDVVIGFVGKISGRIVPPRGVIRPGFEFDVFFLPDGDVLTLAEDPSFIRSARYVALEKFSRRKFDLCAFVSPDWEGKFQEADDNSFGAQYLERIFR